MICTSVQREELSVFALSRSHASEDLFCMPAPFPTYILAVSKKSSRLLSFARIPQTWKVQPTISYVVSLINSTVVCTKLPSKRCSSTRASGTVPVRALWRSQHITIINGSTIIIALIITITITTTIAITIPITISIIIYQNVAITPGPTDPAQSLRRLP